jgi:hypothetical protein
MKMRWIGVVKDDGNVIARYTSISNTLTGGFPRAPDNQISNPSEIPRRPRCARYLASLRLLNALYEGIIYGFAILAVGWPPNNRSVSLTVRGCGPLPSAPTKQTELSLLEVYSNKKDLCHTVVLKCIGALFIERHSLNVQSRFRKSCKSCGVWSMLNALGR